jgi:uncharacterized membrane protein
MLVLRFLHIVGGVLWVGSVFLLTAFVGPSAAEVGPASGPFMSTLVKKRRLSRVVGGLAVVTVVAGWWMWAIGVMEVGSVESYVGSTFGLVLTIGGVLATVAAAVGIPGVDRKTERLVDLGDEIRAAGGPPTEDQRAESASLGAAVRRNGLVVLVLLILAVGAMATARYW